MLAYCNMLAALVALALAVLGNVQAKTDCSLKVTACEEKSASSRRPVCGTDNQTYPSRCHLLRAHCQPDGSIVVSVKHRGRCREKQPCWADQGMKDPVPSSSEGQDMAFVPTCLADGRYAPVQCHNYTGYCWCVTPSGKPIQNTSVKHSRPRCNRRGKTRRGSSPRGSKQRKDCDRLDRSTFVTNLVKIFRTEYNRLPASMTNFSGENAEIDRRVLEWKFSVLDHDNNDLLSRDEYRDLRRLIVKVVKPRRCARAFAKNCDLDSDLNIAHQEWTTCLGMDFDLLQESVATLTDQLSRSEDTTDHRDEPDAIDCLTDRQAVLDETKASNEELYIPECMPDGRYQKIQCYKSTGYCWCVHEDSGKPIPGTSVKNLNPKCESVQAPSRPMKGCPEHRKQVFLKDLMEFLVHTMATQKMSNSSQLREELQEEHIAAWNFMVLDSNKNKVLERNEWKSFRAMISTHRKLRRCGKKLPRYCDVNHDRKISLTEWLNCLNAQRSTTDASSSTPAHPRRKGPNPLEFILKPDD